MENHWGIFKAFLDPVTIDGLTQMILAIAVCGGLFLLAQVIAKNKI